jgi:hypothetical protein
MSDNSPSHSLTWPNSRYLVQVAFPSVKTEFPENGVLSNLPTVGSDGGTTETKLCRHLSEMPVIRHLLGVNGRVGLMESVHDHA